MENKSIKVLNTINKKAELSNTESASLGAVACLGLAGAAYLTKSKILPKLTGIAKATEEVAKSTKATAKATKATKATAKATKAEQVWETAPTANKIFAKTYVDEGFTKANKEIADRKLADKIKSIRKAQAATAAKIS